MLIAAWILSANTVRRDCPCNPCCTSDVDGGIVVSGAYKASALELVAKGRATIGYCVATARGERSGTIVQPDAEALAGELE